MAVTSSDEMFDKYGCDLLLFRNVKNASALHQMLISRDEEAKKLRCVLLKPDLVIDPVQIAMAVGRARAAFEGQSKAKKTRSIYTEVLYYLSPTKNITSSLQTFGLSGSETEVMAVILDEADREVIAKEVAEAVEGDLHEAAAIVDYEKDLVKIAKIHKLDRAGCDDDKKWSARLFDTIISRTATKDMV